MRLYPPISYVTFSFSYWNRKRLLNTISYRPLRGNRSHRNIADIPHNDTPRNHMYNIFLVHHQWSRYLHFVWLGSIFIHRTRRNCEKLLRARMHQVQRNLTFNQCKSIKVKICCMDQHINWNMMIDNDFY